MFKLIKNYIKNYINYKIILIIEDKLLYYSSRKIVYQEKIYKWENKKYDELSYFSKENFESTRNDKLKWYNEQYIKNHNKYEAIQDTLKSINELLTPNNEDEDE